MINPGKRLYTRFRNLILYGIIGAFCAGLDFTIYTVLCHYGILTTQWANVISVHIGIFTSFLLNRSLNFKVKNRPSLRFFSFYLVGLAGLGISALMLQIMVTDGDMIYWKGKLIATVVVALIQFMLNKYITFYTKHKK